LERAAAVLCHVCRGRATGATGIFAWGPSLTMSVRVT
jgi:hypothetical protein